MSTNQRLPRSIEVKALAELCAGLARGLGVSFEPGEPECDSKHFHERGYRVSVDTTRWVDGEITLVAVQDQRDNSGSVGHHWQWSPSFEATATLEGLPDETVVHFSGSNMGATAVSAFRVEGPQAERVAELLLEQFGE